MISDKQLEPLKFANDPEKFSCLSVGTVRSGKTWSSVLAFFLYTQQLTKPHWHLITGKKLKVIETELLPHFQDLAQGLDVSYDYSKWDSVLRIGEQQYRVVAGNDDHSHEMIQGATFHSELIDEGTLIPENYFNTCISRCTFPDSKVWITCNPSYPLHYLKKKWIDAGKIDVHLEFTFDDNPILTKEAKQRYATMFAGVFAKRMVHGLWAASDGLIFAEFKEESIPLKNVQRVDLGIDYGVASPSAIVPLVEMKRTIYSKEGTRTKRIHHIPRSILIPGGNDRKNRTDKQLAEMINKVALSFMGKCKTVVIDPSAKGLRLELLKLKNRSFAVRRAKNDVLPGIRVMDVCLSHELVSVSPKAESLIKEFESYSWEPEKEEEPIKENDHCCDAARYVLMERFYRTLSLGNARLPEGM